MPCRDDNHERALRLLLRLVDHGLSQKQIAGRTGLNRTYLCKLLAPDGTARAGRRTTQKLEHLFMEVQQEIFVNLPTLYMCTNSDVPADTQLRTAVSEAVHRALRIMLSNSQDGGWRFSADLPEGVSGAVLSLGNDGPMLIVTNSELNDDQRLRVVEHELTHIRDQYRRGISAEHQSNLRGKRGLF